MMSLKQVCKKAASGVFAGSMLVGGLTLADTSPADASAYSCTGYGVGWRYGRPAQFCADTQGSGTYVVSVGAGYSAPIAWTGWLNNTRVRVELIDDGGRVYWASVSSQHNGGSAVGGWKWTLNSHVRRGTVRYTLLSNGAQVAVVQQRIG